MASTRQDGYVIVERAEGSRYEHVQVAERALGHALPAGAEVHHWDENPSNNEPGNLVICPSKGYHKLLHARMRALDACGNPNWLKCHHCKTYDAPENLKHIRAANGYSGHVFHRLCRNADMRKRHSAKRKRKETMNAVAILTLLLQYSEKITQIAGLLSQAKAENRDVTDAELDTLFAGDDAARAALAAAIAAAKAA